MWRGTFAIAGISFAKPVAKAATYGKLLCAYRRLGYRRDLPEIFQPHTTSERTARVMEMPAV
jgi:hypothetical protein